MHRWKFSALAAAAAATVGLYSPNVLALALGPITVQSALGEPLRAEINLPQITPSEAETLRVTPATPETFRAQGMEYSPAIPRIQIELQRRPNGRTVLRLTSDRPVNEPFVDLVVDANWNTGRVTRSYTMLFDPPTLRRAPAAVVTEPQTSAPTQAAASPATTRPSVVARPAQTPATASAPTGEATVVVKAGDTAGRIANANRPTDVSLDQMLVALLRANPDAFIQGNVNRIKAGAVLQMPSEAQANATTKGEARQILAAQSRDFSEFRRKLAGVAPAAEVASPGRAASGSVQAQVQDQRPTSAAPDKLTLSKGAVKGQKTTEEELAKRKQANEASARVQELSKNISDLSKLSAASAPAGESPAAASPASASSPSGLTVPVAAAPASSAEPAAPIASAPEAAASAPTEVASEAAASASAAESAASAPAAAPVAPAVTVAPPPPAPSPVEEPGFLTGLMDDPMVPLAGGGLLALLLGYGAWRVVQRRRNGNGMDSSFLESRLQPDSFFGASGGQRVDTAGSDSTTGGSSMAYSPSQLDAGGDVDPVAEADVYLAYGRDLQAEEILKEAVRHNPTRVSVHAKLGEIYAKRQDRKALEAVATEIHNLTNGEGSDWNRIAELGRDLDPENTLYQPGGRPSTSAAAAAVATVAAAGTTMPPDLDLDLELDLPDDALTEAPAVPAGGFAAAAAGVKPAVVDSAPAPLEIPELGPEVGSVATQPAWQPPVPSMKAAPSMAASPLPTELDVPLDLPSLDTLPNELDTPTTASKAYAPSDSGLMEFDLDSISLDLKTPGREGTETQDDEPTTASGDLADDPLTTKLALAQEFNTIGDSDGARTLIEEVIAESSGALKARAQKMLSELG